MSPTTALHFSGGKDSLACLHLYRERWAETLVCWVNTGAAYPQTVEYMALWKRRLPHFLEIRSDQPAQVAREGYPCEVVPVGLTSFGHAVTGREGVRLQSHFGCCAANLWRPMQEAMSKLGIRRIVRGQRRDDRRKSPITNGFRDERGVEYLLPIEDWSEADVREYLAEVGAELPPYYGAEKTSRDCWDCTAYLDDNAERIRALPAQQRAEVLRRLRLIREAVDAEMVPLQDIVRAA